MSERVRPAEGRSVASCLGAALVLAIAVGPAGAEPPGLQGPGFLPGDRGGPGAAAGDQEKPSIAPGGPGYLVVWTDMRTSDPSNDGFGNDQSGQDVYAARLDANGDRIDTTPIVVNQAFGYQQDPRVAWNGENWLVVWENQTPWESYYASRIYASRVGPDGTVLDDPPVEVWSTSVSSPGLRFDVTANGSEWLVVGEGNADQGIVGIRVAGDGTILDLVPVELVPEMWYARYDTTVRSAQGEYLLVYDDYGTNRADRFEADLTPIGSTTLPGTVVASNGTEYFLVWDPGPQLLGSRMRIDGTLRDPAGIPIMDSNVNENPSDLSWDGVNWWVSHFADESVRLARIDPGGTVLDPGGFPITDPAIWSFIGQHRMAAAETGGAYVVWDDQRCNCTYEWDVRLDPWDIHGAHASASGQPGSEEKLSLAEATQEFPDLATGPDQFLAVFVSEKDNARRIVAQRLDAVGNALDPEPVEIATSPYVTNPAAAWNGSVYMIVWEDSGECRLGSPNLCPPDGTVRAVRMLPDGALLDSVPITVMPGAQPDVEALDGTFLVVGTHFTRSITHWRITFAMRVDGATGALLDAAPLELGWVFATVPRVTTFLGSWLVVWEQRGSHNESWGYARANFVEADGTVGEAFRAGLATPDAAASGAVALVVGRFRAANNDTNSIMGTLIYPDRTAGSSFTISDAPDRQRAPAVTWDGANFLVVWEDMRNATVFFDQRTDLYGARVTEAGEVLDPDGFVVAGGSLPDQQPSVERLGGDTLIATSLFRDQAPDAAYRLGVFHTPGTVTDPPEVAFDAAPTAGCAALPVQFTDRSTGEVSSWSWNFGDGGTSAEQNPLHVYPDAGTYTVYLTAGGALGSNTEVKFDYVTVDEATAADFTADLTTGCAPFTVGFTDLSAGLPTSWAWVFGDDGTSTEQNPLHTYEYPGIYSVMLTATGGCGPDTVTKIGYVVVDRMCPIGDYALEEQPVYGHPAGSFLNTHPDTGATQGLTEEWFDVAGDTGTRFEHRWRFEVTGGPDGVDFYVDMHKSTSLTAEDYHWEYSTDNVSFTRLLTVTESGWTVNRVPMPAGFQGSVWVRVIDSDRSPGEYDRDGISIRGLGFETIVPTPSHRLPAVMGLESTDRDSMRWLDAGSASHYDVMRGDLGALRTNGSVGDALCALEDHAGTTLSDYATPAPGKGYYYVIRGDAAQKETGTLDNPPGLSAPDEYRDDEVGTSGGSACGDMP